MAQGIIAVIIPYYQREGGLLNRALRSIAIQHTTRSIRVVIVDDESPLPPDEALNGISGLEIAILRQRNSGPGAARNRALASLGSDVEFVAFLDSDDTWRPNHLRCAEIALDRHRATFFFSEYCRANSEQSELRRTGFDPSLHTLLDPKDLLYRYDGSFFDAVLHLFAIGTSTVVYRLTDASRSARFANELRFSHEDTLGWLEVLSHVDTAAFTPEVTVDYGLGVNIFASSGWGTPTALRRLADEIGYLTIATTRYAGRSPAFLEFARDYRSKIREEAAREFLHQMRRGFPRGSMASAWRYLKRDPRMLSALIPIGLETVLRK